MFHINLKNRRLICGLSQKQVADYLNITPQSISKWEKGDASPGIEYLPKLAECLKCEINDFFAEVHQETANIEMLDKFFALMAERLNQTKNSEDTADFLMKYPTAVEETIDFCSKLLEHQTIQAKTIQGILSCDVSKANVFVEHLIRCEMIEKLEISDAYFVIKDSVDGFIVLLKVTKELCQYILKDKYNFDLV